MKNPHGIQIVDVGALNTADSRKLAKLLGIRSAVSLPCYVVTMPRSQWHNQEASDRFHGIARRLGCYSYQYPGKLIVATAGDTYARLSTAVSKALGP